MLQQLQIQNYAIIDELGIDFSGKLNIITGETGAGKSILMGALSLILGGRADTGVLVDREKKCVVEGTFSIAGNKAIRHYLMENDLDADDELVIRREIGTNGKSRAFISDTPVNLRQLEEIGHSLVDLHQQFDAAAMAESDFQREVLDALAGNSDVVTAYQSIYRQWQSARKALSALKEQKEQFDTTFDYTQFLFEELDQAGFRENELENLEAELRLLSNTEGIKAALSGASYQLQESESPVVAQLKVMINQLQPFAGHHADLQVIIERLQSTYIELQDITGEIERLNDHVSSDPKRIEQLNERISTGYRLFKKHGVQTTAALLAVRAELEEKLRAVSNLGDTIAIKEKETGALYEKAMEEAASISRRRHSQVESLEQKVNALLAEVGMPNARLKVVVADAAMLQISGMDTIEFLFDANKSSQFAPIRKVASGGELSRLMLCIKSLVAQSVDLPTMIFDEIDSGISGEAARQVGRIMKELSDNRQIICITHQPQIAGKADAHYFVYKRVVGEQVKTGLKLLSREERINAIAQMLSGEKPTAAALENAREMIMR